MGITAPMYEREGRAKYCGGKRALVKSVLYCMLWQSFFFFFFFGIQVYCPGYSHETDADVSTSAERYYLEHHSEAIMYGGVDIGCCRE